VLDIESLSPVPYRTIYLVRHGQYEPSITSPDSGDGPLTPLGREQAHRVGQRMQGLELDIIHHSTLIRATETAEIIATYFTGVELRASALLKECLPSVPPSARAWLGDGVSASTLRRGDAQARRVYREWFQPLAPGAIQGRRELVVSSGNLISYLVCRMIGAPGTQWVHASIQHCGISEALIGGGRGRLLLRHNDTGHLPARMQTI
jgi:broad specificity phosphatase PhoE